MPPISKQLFGVISGKYCHFTWYDEMDNGSINTHYLTAYNA
jgi:hypothetical protein